MTASIFLYDQRNVTSTDREFKSAALRLNKVGAVVKVKFEPMLLPLKGGPVAVVAPVIANVMSTTCNAV
jgi:hypothetical protein